ncbi:MAG TPA: hypothetical protein VMG82_25545 [Candidatus Sulfotelmatobacter sp.]|nr:hypothetical protein [Candidatus Sulfotelmatobacter sp.]
MRSQLISPAMSAFFALLAAVFLVLSATRGTPPARKTWRRLAATFIVVAAVLTAIQTR